MSCYYISTLPVFHELLPVLGFFLSCINTRLFSLAFHNYYSQCFTCFCRGRDLLETVQHVENFIEFENYDPEIPDSDKLMCVYSSSLI